MSRTVGELKTVCDTAVQLCRTSVTSQPPQRAPRVWFSLVSPSGRPTGLFEYLGVGVYRLVTANQYETPKSVAELDFVGYVHKVYNRENDSLLIIDVSLRGLEQVTTVVQRTGTGTLCNEQHEGW